MFHESDDEIIHVSKSEPACFGRSKNEDCDDYIEQSKSDTFTKFGPRKLSLLSDNLKETDVYLTRNPGDNWLRKHLNGRKQVAEAKESVDGNAETLTREKENVPEESTKEKMTVESIKKKYGRPIKSQRVSKRGKCHIVFYIIFETFPQN